jgi:hypothetical protein
MRDLQRVSSCPYIAGDLMEQSNLAEDRQNVLSEQFSWDNFLGKRTTGHIGDWRFAAKGKNEAWLK